MNNRARHFITYWLPALLWIAIVGIFSSAQFRSNNSMGILWWLLDASGIYLTGKEFVYLHGFLRKMAHFFSYAMMSLLCFRAARGPLVMPRWKPRYALAALAVCLVVACVDELNQAYTPGRTGTVKDVVLDMVGALFAQLALVSWMADGKRKVTPPSPAGKDAGAA